MGPVRKPFQGVLNIVKFNWHHYLLSSGFILSFFSLKSTFSPTWQVLGLFLSAGMIFTIFLSLGFSYYIYDCSGLYTLRWLNALIPAPLSRILNVHAGFDEMSQLLQVKFPNVELLVFDFYDPIQHTEVSIKRARSQSRPISLTKSISTKSLPLADGAVDLTFVALAAHEIRSDSERVLFFKELRRTLTAHGRIFVVEHLRDFPNFIAYNIGFLHFLSKATWHETFESANLQVFKEIKITPFISLFILGKHGTAP